MPRPQHPRMESLDISFALQYYAHAVLSMVLQKLAITLLSWLYLVTGNVIQGTNPSGLKPTFRMLGSSMAIVAVMLRHSGNTNPFSSCATPDKRLLYALLVTATNGTWVSNYDDTWFNFWCQNGTPGNNVVLGSQFNVTASGSLPYVLAEDDPSQQAFPVACHAELAVARFGTGVNGPVGVTFTSEPNIAAKTISFSPTIKTSSPSIPITITATLSLTSFSSSTTTATRSGSSSSATAGSKSDAQGGLSGIAKAGIGIGFAFGFIIAISGSVFWIWWRKRRFHPRGGSKELKDTTTIYPLESSNSRKHELNDNLNTHELPGSRPAVHELGARSTVYELAAGS
ncbi:hypothetical protein B7463_g1685, partial [Scytalidium lignicola]